MAGDFEEQKQRPASSHGPSPEPVEGPHRGPSTSSPPTGSGTGTGGHSQQPWQQHPQQYPAPQPFGQQPGQPYGQRQGQAPFQQSGSLRPPYQQGPSTSSGTGPYPPGGVPPQERAILADLADGNWHRLHPATMWINIIGGIVGFFWVGIVLLSSLLPALIENALPGVIIMIALAVVVIGAALVVVGSWLGYRNTEFRLTDEVFELRKGVINKSNRQVRFDRLQSVNLNRPVFARIFNLTDVETSGAGDKSGFSLKYLNSDQANALRAEILRRASGAKKRKSQRMPDDAALAGGGWQGPSTGSPSTGSGSGTGVFADEGPSALRQAPLRQPQGPASSGTGSRRNSLGAFVDRAVEDFAGPELSPEMVAEQSVVRVKPGRMAATAALGGALGALITIVLSIIGWVIARIVLGAALPYGLPALFNVVWVITTVSVVGMIIFITLVSAASTALGNMQYTIAGTPDGLRVGRGILNQTNDTLPPGRIHSIEVRQPLLWRPFKWYMIRVNRADVRVGTSTQEQQNAQQRFVVLPVGTRDEVDRVLQLVMPMHMGPRTAQLLTSGFEPGPRPEFTPAPMRAWWLHPFSIRFIGGAIDGGLVYFRTGWLSRAITMVPGERMQSVTSRTSLLERLARVGHVRIDTVAGPVRPVLPAVSAELLNGLHEELSRLAIRAAKDDTSHRWFEAQARATVAAAHMHAADAQRLGRPLDAQTQRVLAAEDAWRREQQAAGAGVGGGPVPPQGPRP